MSYTEIYAFDKEGKPSLYGEVHNAWRSGMAVWGLLEQKYLPPHIPSYVEGTWWYTKGVTTYERVCEMLHYSPTRTSDLMSKTAMKEIWDLWEDKRVSLIDKIVLGTTFDKVLIRKEELPKVIDAFKKFEGQTSLKEEAEILQKLYEDENCIAVGWNQTSVSADCLWIPRCDENDNEIHYNCLIGDQHWWLFDEIGE